MNKLWILPLLLIVVATGVVTALDDWVEIESLVISGTSDESYVIGYSPTVQLRHAQSFTPTQSAIPLNVTLFLGRNAGTAPTDNVSVRIETDSAGIPSGTLFNPNAYGTIRTSDFTASGDDYLINFSGVDVSLVAGVKYWVVVSRTGAPDSGQYALIRFEWTNPYPDGDMVTYDTAYSLVNSAYNVNCAPSCDVRMTVGLNDAQQNFTIVAQNSWNSSRIQNFTARIDNGTGTANYSTLAGQINTTIPSNSDILHTVFIEAGNYFNTSYGNVNVSSQLTASTSKAVAYLRAVNSLTNESISTWNLTITNNSKTYTTTNGLIIINATEGSINLTVRATGYVTTFYNQILNFASLENKSYNYSFPADFRLHFWDEKNLTRLDMSLLTNLQLDVICTGNTVSYTIPKVSNDYNFTAPCAFDKLRFFVDYPQGSYYRTLLLPISGGDKNIYLINLPYNSTALLTTFVVYDLTNAYENAQLVLYKQIANSTEQILGDYIDAESKVPAYLLLNGEYTLAVRSSNRAEQNIGKYTASVAGTKYLQLFSINFTPILTGLNNVASFTAFLYNNSGLMEVHAYWNDTSSTTTQTTFTLQRYNYTTQSYSTIYTTSSTSNAVLYTYLAVAGATEPYKVILDVINPTYGNAQYVTILQANTVISNLPHFKNTSTLKWILIALMAVFALFFTAQTANIGGLLIAGFALLLSFIGWFGIGAPILGIITIVALMQILKQGEQRK